jgi:hypothetical protein
MTHAGFIPAIALVKSAAVADTGAAPCPDLPGAGRGEGAGRWNRLSFYSEWAPGRKSEELP